MEPNIPELPTIETCQEEQVPLDENKLKETLQENIRFFKSLFYLTKKIFML
ncbi:hypothetical protein [Seonamhaeicola sp.]|uniref:hypothetical protein n=1 Tax=Seonamhaeicola sp. TaxID=1912245 RepID=UPI00262E0AFC|nr:hypothetical protein [Seonamhaeicola sp.]